MFNAILDAVGSLAVDTDSALQTRLLSSLCNRVADVDHHSSKGRMAQLDSSSYFDALAVSMKEHNEKLSESVTQLKVYYQKQLWHEFSSTVVQLMLEPAFRVAAYDIHDILIVPVRSSIDGSVYVRLLFHACAALASSGETDSLDRVNSLLDSAIASLLSNGHNQCVSAVHCLKALMLMAHGPSLEAKSLLHRAADAIAETPYTCTPTMVKHHTTQHTHHAQCLCLGGFRVLLTRV